MTNWSNGHGRSWMHGAQANIYQLDERQVTIHLLPLTISLALQDFGVVEGLCCPGSSMFDDARRKQDVPNHAIWGIWSVNRWENHGQMRHNILEERCGLATL